MHDALWYLKNGVLGILVSLAMIVGMAFFIWVVIKIMNPFNKEKEK